MKTILHSHKCTNKLTKINRKQNTYKSTQNKNLECNKMLLQLINKKTGKSFVTKKKRNKENKKEETKKNVNLKCIYQHMYVLG